MAPAARSLERRCVETWLLGTARRKEKTDMKKVTLTLAMTLALVGWYCQIELVTDRMGQ